MLEITDLIPQASEFTLRATGKTYRIRPITLQDEIWIKKTFSDQIESIFKELKTLEICRMVFHQLEDKSDFVKREVKVVNESGDEETYTLGGVELLCALISGYDEKMKIISCLLDTIGISKPVIEKIEQKQLSDKEKEEEKKKLHHGQ